LKKKTGKIPFYKIAELKNLDDGDRDFELHRLENFVNDIDHLKLPHRHDHFALYYVTNGIGRHSLDFFDYELQAGRIFFSYAGQVHAWLGDPKVKGFVLLFNASYFNRNEQMKYLRDFIFFNSLQREPYLDLDKKEIEHFSGLFESIENEHSKKTPHQIIIHAYLTILLYELLRRYNETLNPDKAQRTIIEKVRNFEILVDKSFKVNKSVSAFAETLNISPNYLNTICKKVKGRGAAEIIHNRIILEAKRYLIHTTQSVSEISYSLGFEDNSYFGRFFKRQCGEAPAEFRKSIITE
jgi:AraC family transcriptional activator of pobA